MIYGTKQCPECGGYPKFTSLLKGNRNSRRLEYGLVCSNSECPWNRFSIMYASRDKAIAEWNKKVMRHQESKTKSPWHIGTPTEEGRYLLCFPRRNEVVERYEVAEFDGRNFVFATGMHQVVVRTSPLSVAWQKIEPYKEKEK